MQLSPRTGHIVEKIIRDHDGRLVRATFYIYQSGTRVRARLVSSEFIQEAKKIASKVFALSALVDLKGTVSLPRKALATWGPFFTINQLYFSGSKPRAPAF